MYEIRHALEFGREEVWLEKYLVCYLFAECWGWTMEDIEKMKAKDVEVMLEIARWKLEKERREVERIGKV